jgi:hypothetical protein
MWRMARRSRAPQATVRAAGVLRDSALCHKVLVMEISTARPTLVFAVTLGGGALFATAMA